MRSYIILILAIAAMFGCAASHPRATDVLAGASATEFGSAGYGCIDTIAVAQSAGYNYREVVDASLRRDRAGMHTMFEMSVVARFDAASSQGHAAVLGLLLRHLGDGFFGGVLEKENRAVQTAVRDYLQYDFAVDEQELAGWYPITFKNDSNTNASEDEVPARVYRAWQHDYSYYALVAILDAHIDPNVHRQVTKEQVRHYLGDGIEDRDNYPNAGPDFWVYYSARLVSHEHILLVEFDQAGFVKQVGWASE